ncbi:hypothetical protein BGZ95_009122 [Linnemannia exigua]|uniref:FAD-binding PCMH-type domain-containing protein n=1 Tax=Linnemannia exigua TaxID=604196 RepID=A0AAD4DDN3_9FUNG|nr:hypothetical protein BGZ95_009122 [Linnemannia exigua]
MPHTYSVNIPNALILLVLFLFCAASVTSLPVTPAVSTSNDAADNNNSKGKQKQQTISQALQPPRQCRCLPSQPCWPSFETWAAFNATVGGRLISTHPIQRECHDPFYNKTQCDQIRKQYSNLNWRMDQPGGIQYANWETTIIAASNSNNSSKITGRNDSMPMQKHHKFVGCLAHERSMPCYQGAIPLYTVRATTTEDVQKTIRFAAQHNLKLVIKNTGHDLLGRSTAANALSLWTHALIGATMIDGFIPEGSPPCTQAVDKAIVLGSGVLWEDAYTAAAAQGRIIVGGVDSVGAAGGYCLGGGHSIISPHFGLCVDNVLEYKIVTADSELKVANEHQNQDLFWALRGGGPGFGVVVEAVYRTHPAPTKGIVIATAVILTFTKETRTAVLTALFAHHQQWSQAGWSGITMVEQTQITLWYGIPDATIDEMRASFEPFLEFVRWKIQGSSFFLSKPILSYVQYKHYDNLAAVMEALKPATRDAVAGTHRIVGSRLIPQALFEPNNNIDNNNSNNNNNNNSSSSGGGSNSSSSSSSSSSSDRKDNDKDGPRKLAEALADIHNDVQSCGGGLNPLEGLFGGPTAPTRGYLLALIAGRAVAALDNNNTTTTTNNATAATSAGTSVTPAWRKALVHALVILDWKPNDDGDKAYEQKKDIQRAMTSSIQRLAEVTPGSGAYLNEADPQEPDWQNSFWGRENYARLYAIKQLVDPQGLFSCWHCVGSEDWDDDLMCPK